MFPVKRLTVDGAIGKVGTKLLPSSGTMVCFLNFPGYFAPAVIVTEMSSAKMRFI